MRSAGLPSRPARSTAHTSPAGSRLQALVASRSGFLSRLGPGASASGSAVRPPTWACAGHGASASTTTAAVVARRTAGAERRGSASIVSRRAASRSPSAAATASPTPSASAIGHGSGSTRGSTRAASTTIGPWTRNSSYERSLTKRTGRHAGSASAAKSRNSATAQPEYAKFAPSAIVATPAAPRPMRSGGGRSSSPCWRAASPARKASTWRVKSAWKPTATSAAVSGSSAATVTRGAREARTRAATT